MTVDADNSVDNARATERSIVIVDDEALQRWQLIDALSDLSIDVYEAGDGHTAVEIIKNRRPALVIMDIRMPGLDGVAAVEAIQGMHKKPKIILMTGDPESLQSANEKRPDVFAIIEKPIPLRLVRRFVMEALGVRPR